MYLVFRNYLIRRFLRYARLNVLKSRDLCLYVLLDAGAILTCSRHQTNFMATTLVVQTNGLKINTHYMQYKSFCDHLNDSRGHIVWSHWPYKATSKYTAKSIDYLLKTPCLMTTSTIKTILVLLTTMTSLILINLVVVAKWGLTYFFVLQ